MMKIYLIIALSFWLIFLGVLFAVGWAKWFPKTRCQSVNWNSPRDHNVCIKNKSHDGPHLTADGHEFRE